MVESCKIFELLGNLEKSKEAKRARDELLTSSIAFNSARRTLLLIQSFKCLLIPKTLNPTV